ncbi:MAG: RNA polymerase subunit sigma-70 [Bacillota bacterium]
MDDDKIIGLYLARDEAAIVETKIAYGQKLDNLSFNILGNIEDARECVNDTYLQTWNSIPPQKPTYLFAFISKICRHLCFGRLDYKNAKKRSFETITLSSELANCIPDRLAQEEFDHKVIGEVLTAFLNTLSKDHRVIFMRRY